MLPKTLRYIAIWPIWHSFNWGSGKWLYLFSNYFIYIYIELYIVLFLYIINRDLNELTLHKWIESPWKTRKIVYHMQPTTPIFHIALDFDRTLAWTQHGASNVLCTFDHSDRQRRMAMFRLNTWAPPQWISYL